MFQLVVDEYGPGDHPVVRVLTNQAWPSIAEGDYRLVYGIPRRMWQFGDTLNEHYYYELLATLGEKDFQELLDAYKAANAEPLHAYEIEGHFNPDGAYWEAGARLKLDNRAGGTATLALPEWKFRLYKGDKLFDAGGRLIMQFGSADE